MEKQIKMVRKIGDDAIVNEMIDSRGQASYQVIWNLEFGIDAETYHTFGEAVDSIYTEYEAHREINDETPW